MMSTCIVSTVFRGCRGKVGEGEVFESEVGGG